MNAISMKYYDEYTFRDPRRPLNLSNLITHGAVRITYAGNGKGGWINTSDPESFSVVTLMNDVSKNSPTPSWPNKPLSYQIALKLMNAPLRKDHLLYDGKWRQILWSANALGMAPSEIFLRS
jgi:hypothetical protein